MTENTPRHLDDITAMMPAVPKAPKHSADDPERRGTPYLDSGPTTNELRAQRPRVQPTRAADRARARKLPLWKRFFGLTK